jgi:hypothetical protein
MFQDANEAILSGVGWKIGERRECLEISIETTSISIEFKWWNRQRLESSYTYTPNNSMESSYMHPKQPNALMKHHLNGIVGFGLTMYIWKVLQEV